jgi:filamentous hemagglutinin
LGKGGLTKAGRALDKHATGQRGVSPFPPLTGNNANKNLIAQQQVDEILYHPDVVFVGIGNKGAVEAIIPDGRGIRFNVLVVFRDF